LDPDRRFMVNVDGLKMPARGSVRVSVDGKVHLVAGRPDAHP
jgi:hypothetical protein